MNKIIITIIGVVVVAGAIFALKNFYDSSAKPEPTPTTTSQPSTTSSVLNRIEAAIKAKLKR